MSDQTEMFESPTSADLHEAYAALGKIYLEWEDMDPDDKRMRNTNARLMATRDLVRGLMGGVK